MAITRNKQFVRLTDENDVVEDRLIIQGLHVIGSNIKVTDKEGLTLISLGPAEFFTFPCKLEVNGLSFEGDGELNVFLT